MTSPTEPARISAAEIERLVELARIFNTTGGSFLLGEKELIEAVARQALADQQRVEAGVEMMAALDRQIEQGTVSPAATAAFVRGKELLREFDAAQAATPSPATSAAPGPMGEIETCANEIMNSLDGAGAFDQWTFDGRLRQFATIKAILERRSPPTPDAWRQRAEEMEKWLGSLQTHLDVALEHGDGPIRQQALEYALEDLHRARAAIAASAPPAERIS